LSVSNSRIAPFPQNGVYELGPTVNVGSNVSMRLIADPGNWTRHSTASLWGESGVPANPHWKDQLDDWRKRHAARISIHEGSGRKRDERDSNSRTRAEMKTPTEYWRVFIAIELPNYVRVGLAEHVKSLRDSIPEAHASWIREDNLHLTLKFLGDIPVTNVRAAFCRRFTRRDQD